MNKPKKIDSCELFLLFSEIKDENEESIGVYKYKKLRIIVGKDGSKVKDRVMRRYHRLKEQGLCVYCGRRKKKEGRLCKQCKVKLEKKRKGE